MIRSALISSLALSLCLLAGCDKNVDGTTPPKDDGQTADKGKRKNKGKGKRKNKGKNKGEDKGDPNDPTKKVCPAETAEYPEPYFGDTVLIRLPKGVTAENFVEFQPGFARLSSEVESVSCIPDFPGAMITYMALASFQDDPNKPMEEFRDETFEAFGYKDVKLSEEKLDPDTRFYQAVLDVPPGGGKADPARAFFQMSSANGNMYAIVFEAHPDAWNALKETFRESAKKMSFLAP